MKVRVDPDLGAIRVPRIVAAYGAGRILNAKTARSQFVGGIVYAEGRFFYHAWDECWLGKWVPFDSTLPGSFVDATHIKFSQGDVTEMYNVARVVGRLKIEVISAE